MTTESGKVEIVDFSRPPEPKRFRINDDIFEAAPELPLGTMEIAANISAARIKDEGVEPILEFFDAILFDQSAARLRERAKSKTEPIGLAHLMPIINWLLEAYGLRPTQPSENSSGSPSETGTSLTDGVQSETSTQLSLGLPVS